MPRNEKFNFARQRLDKEVCDGLFARHKVSTVFYVLCERLLTRFGDVSFNIIALGSGAGENKADNFLCEGTVD